MRFKTAKKPIRPKPSLLEVGFNMEVRSLRARDSTLSLQDARLRILSEFEEDDMLGETEKAWLQSKRIELIGRGPRRRRIKSIADTEIDRLLEEL